MIKAGFKSRAQVLAPGVVPQVLVPINSLWKLTSKYLRAGFLNAVSNRRSARYTFDSALISSIFYAFS
jgi:hypothetical protein